MLPEHNARIEQINTEHHGRFYRVIRGERKNVYPSASTVVGSMKGDGLNEWIARVGKERADEIKDRAAFRGSQLHMMAEQFLLGNNPMEIGEHIMPLPKYLFGKMKPAFQNISDVQLLERKVFTDSLGIAGTVDCCAAYNGIPSVIDFKTGRKETKREWIKGYFAQASIYTHAINEMWGLNVRNTVIIMGTETGVCQVFEDNPYSEENLEFIRSAKRNLYNELSRTRISGN